MIRLAAAMRVLVLGIVFALGCGHTANPEEPVAVVAVPLSDLGPGDVFEVRVYGEEDLSGEYRVSSDGNINFPLVGKLGVDGKTATEISDEISARLTKFIKDPSVSVFVKEYQSKKVYVYGRVQKAGTFPYEDGMNIIQAITLAGGFSDMANQDKAFVTRIVEGQEKRIEVSVKDIGEGNVSNFQLEPGDIVYIEESWY